MPAAWDAFVGRAAELDVLEAALARAGAGEGSVVLVGGEPGIGKSRLVDRFAASAREQGASVVWGQCWEAGGAPAFWPFVQAMRTILRDHGVDVVCAIGETAAADLAQIVPDIRDQLPGLPDADRCRPRDRSVPPLRGRGFVPPRAASRDRPLLVAIDDMHSADTPSMLLLQFLAHELRDARIVLVVVYRSTEVTPEHPLTAAIADLTRVPSSRRLSLEGLTPGELSEYVAQVIGRDVDDAVIAALDARTEGNPLFVSEIIRLMLSEGSAVSGSVAMPDEIPEGVHETIARYVARLSPECREALDSAAVLGRDVPQELLRLLSDLDPRVLLDALDEAVDAGILDGGTQPSGDFRFSHVLVRDALYARLPTAARAHGHLRTAEAIEELHAHDLEPHLSEIAHHYIAAGPTADAATAARYAARAGEAATRRLAYEEAVRLLHAALELSERSPETEATQLDLLVALGDAEVRAGDQSSAQATFLRAAELARRQARPDALARAAIGYGGFVWSRSPAGSPLVRLLEDSLAAVGTSDPTLRVHLLARLAGARRADPDATQRRAEATEAVEIARHLDDPLTLAMALKGYHASIWAPGCVDECLRVAEELVECATRSDDVEQLVGAHCARFTARLELGNFAGAKADVDALAALAPELRQHVHRWVTAISRACLALLQGRFDEAEELARAGRDEGGLSLQTNSEAAYMTQMGVLALDRGRAGDVVDDVARAAEAYPVFWHFPALHARLLAADGRLDQARELVERLAAHGYAAVPDTDNYYLFSLALLADVVEELGDPVLAEPLLERLLPYAHLTAAAPPEVNAGSVARSVAVLEGLLGRREDAIRHFEAAIRQNRELTARPWLARTHAQLGRMLRALDDDAAADEAREHLDAASTIASELGMADPTGEPRSASGTSDAGADQVFRREGDYWTIAYAGRSVRMKDSKGHRYLAALLAIPGRDVAALDLAALGDGTTRSGDRPARSEVADDVLDTQSRAAYRRRIEDLQGEIDEAEAWNDTERASRARGARFPRPRAGRRDGPRRAAAHVHVRQPNAPGSASRRRSAPA